MQIAKHVPSVVTQSQYIRFLGNTMEGMLYDSKGNLIHTILVFTYYFMLIGLIQLILHFLCQGNLIAS